MKHFLYATLVTLFASFASMASAATTTWYVDGDNGFNTLSGSFDFDDVANSFSNINLNDSGITDTFTAVSSESAFFAFFTNAADTKYLVVQFSPSLGSGADPVNIGFGAGNCVFGLFSNCSQFRAGVSISPLIADDGTASMTSPAVPLPAGLPLVCAALGSLAFVRRKNHT